MNFHGIEKDSMLNGDGLRVVLWVSGCSNQCKGCQNPQTWDYKSGQLFTIEDEKRLYQELDKEYISGITFSGKNTAGKYTNDQIDGIATFYEGKCYFVPIDDCSNEIKLRFTLPKNSQVDHVKFAYDYEVNRILNI